MIFFILFLKHVSIITTAVFIKYNNIVKYNLKSFEFYYILKCKRLFLSFVKYGYLNNNNNFLNVNKGTRKSHSNF